MSAPALRRALGVAGLLVAVACTNDFDSFDFPADGGSGATSGAPGTGGNGGTAGACGGDTSPCAGRCVDTDTDPKNCGACGSVCAAGLSCERGSCGCAEASQCGGDGADCRNDRCRCSGDYCRDGETCAGTGQGARCSCNGGDDCGGGDTCCAAGCVDLDDDPANCGACGATCDAGQNCRDGRCRS
jgi:hypothetical protein